MKRQANTSIEQSPRKLTPRVFGHWTIMSSSVLALSACGDGSLSPSTSSGTQSGFALKGPLDAFRIFVDTNANGVFDAGEVSGLTGTDGSFSLNGVSGKELSGEATAGALDNTSGKAVEGLFMAAPVGASVMSPMTTVLAQTDLTEAELRLSVVR